MDKRDQGYSRPRTGGMSHGIPGHPTAKSDNPHRYPSLGVTGGNLHRELAHLECLIYIWILYW